jgi:hypothetical protein
MDTTPNISDGAAELMLMPFWFELASSLLFFAAILVVVIIGHVIVKKRGKGGYNLLISIYAAIILTVAPVPFSFMFAPNSEFIPLLVGTTYIGASIFMFLATIHGLRFVLSVPSNKSL